MTDPNRLQEPSRDQPSHLPVPTDSDPTGEPGDEEEGSLGWRSKATLGTGLLIIVMVAAGLFAAIMVTPQSDENALARPASADLVLAGAAPLSWDPAIISDAVSAQLLSQVFEGLTVLDAASEVRPALAESWSVEQDGQRIVFELREDLAFSDGTPIEAEDVRRSWLRVIDPARPSPLSSLLDDVAGAAAYARGEGSAEAVGLYADGLSLRVDFERPASYFPAVAAVPSLAVVPDGFGETGSTLGPGESFVASGAYVPGEGDPHEVRLEANDDYWDGAPAIERITVITDDGGRSRVDVFEDEAVDWTRISPADASWIRYDRRLGPQLRHTEEMSVEFMGFDTSQPPFDDPAARRAVAMAVDWRRLARLDGPEAEAPRSLVPPGIASGGSDDYLLPYDPKAARAELTAAGYPDGEGFPSISLATYGVGRTDAIAADLRRELGLEVTVERRPFGEHSALLDGDTPALWTLAWSADYPHAHDFLGLLLRSDSSANVGGWSDSTYDELIDAAASTGDAAEQERLYGEAQVILRDQVPLIPMAYGSRWALSREGLRGATISGVGQLRYADLAWAD